MNFENAFGAAVSSLLFVTVLLVFVYIYYSLGLPLMLLGLFLAFLFFFQTFQLRFGTKPGVEVTTRQS